MVLISGIESRKGAYFVKYISQGKSPVMPVGDPACKGKVSLKYFPLTVSVQWCKVTGSLQGIEAEKAS
jgi:hypothetical protein